MFNVTVHTGGNKDYLSTTTYIDRYLYTERSSEENEAKHHLTRKDNKRNACLDRGQKKRQRKGERERKEKVVVTPDQSHPHLIRSARSFSNGDTVYVTELRRCVCVCVCMYAMEDTK